MYDQQWAIARWREDAAKDDPPLYAHSTFRGSPVMYLSISGTPEWYYVHFDTTAPDRMGTTDYLKAVYHMGMPGQNQMKYINGQQQRKIMHMRSSIPWPTLK